MTRTYRAGESRLFPIEAGSEWAAFQKQETTLILLNLLILASLVLVESVFERDIGPPSAFIIALFAARFVMQAWEFYWLSNRATPLTPSAIRNYGNLSICAHLLFAAAASILSEGEDTHYSVLMILPIVAAGFRFSFWGTLATAGVAGGLNLLEVWAYFQAHPNGSESEYFEASAMGLLYLVVGGVVWLLVGQLRHDQETLRTTYAELDRTRNQLIHEEKLSAVGRLSSAIAHEIRNPIGMISSSLSMGMREETDDTSRCELFDIAASEAKRLERFTTDFLTYARTAPPRCEIVSVGSTLAYVIEVSRARAAEKSITLESVDGTPADVSVDPFQIHQALLNLLTNAIDAAPAESSVRVGYGCGHGAVELYVENGGSAIEAESVANIFEPFYTTKPQGTGLGLAIARKIVEAHRGDLTLALNEPGRVRFSMRLPKADLATQEEL